MNIHLVLMDINEVVTKLKDVQCKKRLIIKELSGPSTGGQIMYTMEHDMIMLNSKEMFFSHKCFFCVCILFCFVFFWGGGGGGFVSEAPGSCSLYYVFVYFIAFLLCTLCALTRPMIYHKEGRTSTPKRFGLNCTVA